MDIRKVFSLLFCVLFILSDYSIYAQNVGIGTNTPHSSAQLEVSSSIGGFLPPRITGQQKDAILNPAAGLIIYCTDCGERGEMQYYDGEGWVSMKMGVASNQPITDTLGNTYPTVTIGTQRWIAENLRTTKYNDGSDIPIVTNNTQWANNYNNGNSLQQPMMCWYNNDQTTYNANKFGALYNWYAINPASNGNKNVCPKGWHIPTDAEWTTLINYLDPIADGGNNTTNIAGGKMKSTGVQYWLSPNTAATNSSGFSGLPGGNRFNNTGSFSNIGYLGGWWSSSEDGIYDSSVRGLNHNDNSVRRLSYNKIFGFSVRCLKD